MVQAMIFCWPASRPGLCAPLKRANPQR